MLARRRALVMLLGFSLTWLVAACDDQDDGSTSDSTESTSEESTSTSTGGW